MTRLVWEERTYNAGLDRGVFYSKNGLVEVWNGLISVEESTSSNDVVVRYQDGSKLHNRRYTGDFEGTISAFTYPPSFHDFLTHRRALPFNLSYRTHTALGSRIHLVYNVLVAPSERTYGQEEIEPLSWAFTTKPVPVPGAKATAHLIVDSTHTNPVVLTELEEIIYGSETESPRLPSPAEVIGVYEANSLLTVIDNGDGTFTVTGPDDAIAMTSPNSFEITWPSAVYIDQESYTIRSF